MGKKVLIIDDDPNICELVSITLKSKGLDVISALTGEKGLDAASEFLPDIILLDHRLPDVDGKDVAKKLKTMSAGKKAYIIMMSGEDAAWEELDSSLFAGLLKKPFKLSDMADYVEKCLKK